MYLMPLVIILQVWDLIISVSSAGSTRTPRVSIVRLLASLLNWLLRSHGWLYTSGVYSTAAEISRTFIGAPGVVRKLSNAQPENGNNTPTDLITYIVVHTLPFAPAKTSSAAFLSPYFRRGN